MNRNATFTLVVIFGLLMCLPAAAQPQPHAPAAKAMAGIDLRKDFGDTLQIHSREVVTMEKNDGVPGLNGLMFMR